MTNARRSSGFTLIEVMIVVAILGIIAAIAYPNYTQYVQRSRRDECAAQLVSFAAQLERGYSTTGQYSAPGTFPTCPADGGNATYTLNGALTVINAQNFTLTAVPTAIQASDPCGNLSLTSTGTKGSSGLTVAECWR